MRTLKNSPKWYKLCRNSVILIAILMLWLFLFYVILDNDNLNDRTEQAMTIFVQPKAQHSTIPSIHEILNREFSKCYVDYIVKHNKFPNEDNNIMFLNNVYGKYNESINFIQIGANDGSGDSFQKFLFNTANKYWRGIMMEPAIDPFNKISKIINDNNLNNRILLVNAALSDNEEDNNLNETHMFYTVDEQKVFELFDEKFQKANAFKPGYFQRLGSFDKNHIVKHLNKYINQIRDKLLMKVDDFIVNQYVPSMSASMVLNTYDKSNKSLQDNNDMDLLIMDAEGYDFILLKQLMLNQYKKFRPLLIFYENVHLSRDDRQEAIQFLQDLDYVSFNAFGYNANAIRIDDYNLRVMLNFWANHTGLI